MVKGLSASGEDDDFHPGSPGKGSRGMIAAREGLAIEFCHHWPVQEVQGLEEVGNSGIVFNCVRRSVEDNLHYGRKRSGGGRREDLAVPVFPDRIESLAAELSRDSFGRSVVIDLKLRRGLGVGVIGYALCGIDFDSSSLDRPVEIVCACPGIATRFGVRAGGDVGDPEREEAVPEIGRFTGGKDNSNPGKGNAKGADKLNELAIAAHELGLGLVPVISSVGPEPGEGNGELCLPAAFIEVFEVSGEGEGLGAPVGKAEEGADSNPPKASGIGPFRAIQAPVEPFLGTGGVELFIGFPVIGFLVNDESFRSAGDKFGILFVLQGADLDAKGRH